MLLINQAGDPHEVEQGSKARDGHDAAGIGLFAGTCLRTRSAARTSSSLPALKCSGLLKDGLTVFVGRNPFWEQAREVNGGPSVVSLKSESFKLREACPHPPFFGRRINREPDALFARHVGRPRQAHLAGVVRKKTVNGAHGRQS